MTSSGKSTRREIHDGWKQLPLQPSPSWFRAPVPFDKLDETVIKLFKRFMLSGGDLSHMVVTQHGKMHMSIFELVAVAPHLVGGDVISFLLANGSPLVVTREHERHDAFMAFVERRPPHRARIAVLAQFLDAGYKLDATVAAAALVAARSDGALHTWLVQRIVEFGNKLVVLSHHFVVDSCSSVEQVLRELDVIDAEKSRDACTALFAMAMRDPHHWSQVLLHRVRQLVLVPDTELAQRHVSEIERAELAELLTALNAHGDLLVALLTARDVPKWPVENREAALWQMFQATGGRDVKLLAVALDRTQLDVNHIVNGLTPLAHAVALEASRDTLALLLAKGAFVNAASVADGSTPLHLSRDAGTDELLVRAGADPTLRRFSDNLTAEALNSAPNGDIDRRWFFAKVLPHIKYDELLEICLAVAPLLREFPPELADNILARLPGMSVLKDDIRYSLFVRISAAHTEKVAGRSVSLPARHSDALRKPIKLLQCNDVTHKRGRPLVSKKMRKTARVLLGGGDSAAVVEAVLHVREMLSRPNNPPIQYCIDAGLLPSLVQLASSNDTRIAFEALWALTNVCSGSTEHVVAAVAAGVIPAFVAAVSSSNDGIVEQAVWGLGNCAADSLAMRDELFAAPGLVERLIQLVSNAHCNDALLRNLTWAIARLCHCEPLSRVSPFVPTLTRLLTRSTVDDILSDALEALGNLCESGDQGIAALLQTGCLRRVVELLQHQSEAVQSKALRIVGNVVAGDDEWTQAALDCGALANLVPLLSSPVPSIRKVCVCAVSNIAAGNRAQKQMAIDSGAIQAVVGHFQDAAASDSINETCWTLSNIASGGTFAQVAFVIQQGGIAPFVRLFSMGSDDDTIQLSVEFFRNVLELGRRRDRNDKNPFAAAIEAAGALEALQQLLEHTNARIRDVAANVVQLLGDERELDHHD